MNIYFARTKAGHDKNQIYFILREEGEFVYLINGTTKPLDKAKKKNRKHIQMIKNLPEEIVSIIENGITNESVKRAIKLYQTERDRQI
ncbi:MAG: hypothetical protein HFI37_04895 [Lachnospiraceae bacterium]|nr:hypothetical protein [Lachnospiraceae bacterium]